MKRIDFEGTDGAGKTTQLNHAYTYLTSLGFKVAKLKEVGDPNSEACVKLREIILADESLDPVAMELICMAMNKQNEKYTQQCKADGFDFLLCDRGKLSHIVYGIANCGYEDYVKYAERLTDYIAEPDLILYFDCSVETSYKRREQRGLPTDVIESKGEEFFQNIRTMFNDEVRARSHAKRINAELPIGVVSNMVQEALKYVL